jgi:hypothetical protein
MKKIIVSIMLLISLVGAPLLTPGSASAADCSKNPKAAGCPCAIDQNSAVCKQLVSETTSSTFDTKLKNIINILLFGIGAVSVIMIIVGSIRFTSSRGNSDATGKARMTVTYSVIGLIVAMSAYAIVNFVLDQL